MLTLAGLAFLFGCLGLVVLIAAPIALALVLVGALLHLVFFVVLLPFRLLGAVFGMGFSALGWLVRGSVLLVVLGILLVLGAIPLLPFLLIGGGLYLVFRGMRSRSAPVGHA
jgi:hypothetical protein